MIQMIQIKMLYHNLKRLESKLDTLLHSQETTPETISNNSDSRITFTVPDVSDKQLKVQTFCIDKNTLECFLCETVSIGFPCECRIANAQISRNGNLYWPMGDIVGIEPVQGFLNAGGKLTCYSFHVILDRRCRLRICVDKPTGQPCILEYYVPWEVYHSYLDQPR
jgi:hypothetical protein